jgi:hypothetical protein
MCLLKPKIQKILKSCPLLSWINDLGYKGTFPESVFKSGEKSWGTFRFSFLILFFSAAIILTPSYATLLTILSFLFSTTFHSYSTHLFPSFLLPPQPDGQHDQIRWREK